MTREEIEFLFKMRDEVTAHLNRLNGFLKAQGGEVDALGQKFGNLSQLAKDAGATLASAFALKSAIKNTVGVFGDYEEGLINVAKTANLTDQQLAEFSDEFSRLNQAIRGVDTSELLNIAEVAGQMGIKGAANIAKFTEEMAKLSTAAPSIQGAEGTQLIARILKLTGEGVEGVHKFNSVLVELGNNSAAFEDDILQAASMVSQATAQFNLSSDAILGIGTAMKELNIRDELGGAAIARTLLQIKEATLQDTDGFKILSNALGITREDFQKLVDEHPEEALLKFLSVLRAIPKDQSALSFFQAFNLQAEENQRVLGTLASGEGLPTLMEQLARARKEAGNPQASDREYARGAEKQNSAVQQLINTWTELRATIGEALKPLTDFTLDTVIGAMQTLISAIKSMPDWAQTFVAGSLIAAPAILVVAKAAALLRGAMAAIGVLRLGSVVTGSAEAVAGLANLAGAAGSARGAIFLLTRTLGGLGIALAAGSLAKSLDDTVSEWLDHTMTDKQKKYWQDFRKEYEGFFDFMAMDPFSQVIQSGPNAGKNYLTGEIVYELQDDGSWKNVKEEAQKQLKKIADDAETWTLRPSIDVEATLGTINVPKVPEQLAEKFQQSLGELDPTSGAMANIKEYEAAINALEELSKRAREYGTTKAEGFSASSDVSDEEITRLRNLVEIRKQLADPIASKSRELSDELADTQATTQTQKDRLEVERTIRDVYEQRGAVSKEQEESLTKQVQLIQQARQAAELESRNRDIGNQLQQLQARTNLARIDVQVEQQIADLLREQGNLSEDVVASYRQRLQAVQELQNLYNLMDRVDPVGASQRQYADDQEALNRALQQGIIDQQQFNRLRQQLDQQTLSQRDPVGDRLKSMNDEIKLLRMMPKEREVERNVLSEINSLQQQGVVVTKEMEDAIRRYTQAMADAQIAQQNGIQAWAESVGTFQENFLKLQQDAAGGFVDAIVNGINGNDMGGALRAFAVQLGKNMVDFAVKGIARDFIQSTGIGSGPKNAALDRAQSAADDLNKLKNEQLVQAQQAVVNAGQVTLNGQIANLPGAATNSTVTQNGVGATTVTQGGAVYAPANTNNAPVTTVTQGAANTTPVVNMPDKVQLIANTPLRTTLDAKGNTPLFSGEALRGTKIDSSLTNNIAAGQSAITNYASANQNNPVPVTLAQPPAGTQGSFATVGNFAARGAENVDPRLTDILKVAAERSGYKVEAYSGYRPGDTREHGHGNAADIRLFDPKSGKLLGGNPNGGGLYQTSQDFSDYEAYAQEVRRVQEEMYPELSKDLRWGGYFSGPKGKYGALDGMHFDLAGKRVGMAGGSWEHGLTDQQRAFYPGINSRGMAEGGQPLPSQKMQPVPVQITQGTQNTAALTSYAPQDVNQQLSTASMAIENASTNLQDTTTNFAGDMLASAGKPQEFLGATYEVARSQGLNDVQARLMAAQAGLESGYGKHAPGNNYFGIKASKDWMGDTQRLRTTEQNKYGQPYKTYANFRKYDTPEAGIQDRIAFMQDRYEKAFNSPDLETAVENLKNGKYGAYATDQDYLDKIRRTAEKVPVPPKDIPNVDNITTSSIKSQMETANSSIQQLSDSTTNLGDTAIKTAQEVTQNSQSQQTAQQAIQNVDQQTVQQQIASAQTVQQSQQQMSDQQIEQIRQQATTQQQTMQDASQQIQVAQTQTANEQITNMQQLQQQQAAAQQAAAQQAAQLQPVQETPLRGTIDAAPQQPVMPDINPQLVAANQNLQQLGTTVQNVGATTQQSSQQVQIANSTQQSAQQQMAVATQSTGLNMQNAGVQIQNASLYMNQTGQNAQTTGQQFQQAGQQIQTAGQQAQQSGQGVGVLNTNLGQAQPQTVNFGGAIGGLIGPLAQAIPGLGQFGGMITNLLSSLLSGAGGASGGGGLFGNLFGGLFGFAEGGQVAGPGTGTSDSIVTKVSNGEFIVNAKATKQFLPVLSAINSGAANDNVQRAAVSMFHVGGVVGSSSMSKTDVVSAYASVPKFHSGGGEGLGLSQNEYRAILMRNERVLTQEDDVRTQSLINEMGERISRMNEINQAGASTASGRPARGGANSGMVQNLTMNVNAKDANSFKKSQGQLAAEASIEMRRAATRNG